MELAKTQQSRPAPIASVGSSGPDLPGFVYEENLLSSIIWFEYPRWLWWIALLFCGGAECVHEATSREARGISGGDGSERASTARARGYDLAMRSHMST